MTLGTHAVVGGSLAAMVPAHPVAAFIVGFLSHFVLDSIPHYDYEILSIQKEEGNKLNTDMKLGKLFIFDLLRIGADALIGLAILSLFFRNVPAFPYVILIGAIAAMLPDALQFAYFKLRREPLNSLQRFHLFIHAENDLNDRPLLGLFCQAVVAIIALSVALFVIQ